MDTLRDQSIKNVIREPRKSWEIVYTLPSKVCPKSDVFPESGVYSATTGSQPCLGQRPGQQDYIKLQPGVESFFLWRLDVKQHFRVRSLDHFGC
eukprot:143682-Pyramimonas_sp.AAC.1